MLLEERIFWVDTEGVRASVGNEMSLRSGQGFYVLTPGLLPGASISDKANQRPSKYSIDTSQIVVPMEAFRMCT